jgi:hypothetical protein
VTEDFNEKCALTSRKTTLAARFRHWKDQYGLLTVEV